MQIVAIVCHCLNFRKVMLTRQCSMSSITSFEKLALWNSGQKGEEIMRKTIASVVVVFMCLFMFAGCKPKTIEAAIKPADLQKMVDEMKENSLFKTVYSDASIEVKGNEVTYKYYYKQTMDDEQIEKVKAQLEKSGLEKQIDGLKDNFKKSCGIRSERIAFAYYTSDGKLIAEIAK